MGTLFAVCDNCNHVIQFFVKGEKCNNCNTLYSVEQLKEMELPLDQLENHLNTMNKEKRPTDVEDKKKSVKLGTEIASRNRRSTGRKGIQPSSRKRNKRSVGVANN